jgi:uncharacterized cupredoxin-like copper-binding protein
MINQRFLAVLLLATSVFGACVANAGEEEQTIAVNINHTRFNPDHYDFEAGDTVRFVIHNGDPIDHEFILGNDAVQRRHENGTEKKHGAVPGEVSVPAGETRTTTYTFTQAGDLIIGCHIPGHYAYGMRAQIHVEP